MKTASVLFWLILTLSVASFLVAVLLVFNEGFGEQFSPVFLAAANSENRLKTADFFISVSGFSAATLALIKTYETIRDARRAPVIAYELSPRWGKLSPEGLSAHRYQLPPHGSQGEYHAQLVLRIVNNGSISAQDIVCLVAPKTMLTDDKFQAAAGDGFWLNRAASHLQLLIDEAPSGPWNVDEFGTTHIALRFDPGRAIQLIAGDHLNVGTLDFTIAPNPTAPSGPLQPIELEVRVLSSNAEPAVGYIMLAAET